MKLRFPYQVTLGGALLLFLLLLAGCGGQEAKSSSSDNQVASTTSNQTKEEGASSSHTKSFTDSTGTKQIPVNPQRVFSISASTQLLALGITPIGGLQYEIEQDYYLQDYAKQITIAGDYPPNFESITKLKPDLIIASSFVEPEIVEQLEKIAPTVMYPWEYNLYDQLRYIGDIVGRKEQAEEWIKQHEIKVADSKAQMSTLVAPDKTVAAIEIFKDKFQVAGNRNMGYVLHDLLGLKRLPFVQEEIDKNGGYLVYTEEQSLEKLPELTADYLIVKVNDTQAGSSAFFEEIQNSNLWKELPAVKNGQVYVVPHDKWWSYTLFSTDALLDEAVALFKQQQN